MKISIRNLVLIGMIFSLNIGNVFANNDSIEVKDNVNDSTEIIKEETKNVYVIQKKEDVIPIIAAAAVGASLTSLGLYVLYDQIFVKKRMKEQIKYDSEFDKVIRDIKSGNIDFLKKLLEKSHKIWEDLD